MPLNFKIRIIHTINTKQQATSTGILVRFFTDDLLGGANPALLNASIHGLYSRYVRTALVEPFIRLKGKNAGKSNEATCALG